MPGYVRSLFRRRAWFGTDRDVRCGPVREGSLVWEREGA